MVVDDGPTCLYILHWQKHRRAHEGDIVRSLDAVLTATRLRSKLNHGGDPNRLAESFCLGRSRRAESIQTLISGRDPADAVLTAARLRSNRTLPLPQQPAYGTPLMPPWSPAGASHSIRHEVNHALCTLSRHEPRDRRCIAKYWSLLNL